jgi:hypothetical protein
MWRAEKALNLQSFNLHAIWKLLHHAHQTNTSGTQIILCLMS